MMIKPEVLVSSDIAGLNGNPESVVSVYQPALPLLTAINQGLNLEVIAFRHNYQRFIDQALKLGYQISGWHGPVGSCQKDEPLVSKVKGKIVTSALITMEGLIRLGRPPFKGYLLIHQNQVSEKGTLELLEKEASHIPLLLLENLCHPGSLDQTVQTAAGLTNKGINAGVMIDLLHLFYEKTTVNNQSLTRRKVQQGWEKVIQSADQALYNVQTAGLHIPIGTDHDSLPITIMTDNDWYKLAELIKKHPQIQYLTIENQHSSTKLVLLPSDLPHLALRNKEIIQTLIRTGVLR